MSTETENAPAKPNPTRLDIENGLRYMTNSPNPVVDLFSATLIPETSTYYEPDVRISIPEEIWDSMKNESRSLVMKHNSRIHRIEDAEFALAYYSKLMKRMDKKGKPLIIDREEWTALRQHKNGIVPRIMRFNRREKERVQSIEYNK